MTKLLPPKNSSPTHERVKQLETALSRLIINDPQTIDGACGFYDVIDNYLGPWGKKGYPISYGKNYCIAFNMNQNIRRNNVAWRWVRKTTVKLQTSLKDFIVSRYRDGMLATITESELRKHAFDSHPSAYTEGGLTSVILFAPEMIPIVVSIPGAEFSKSSENYEATLVQTFRTAGLQAPRVIASVMARPALAFIGPAHRGNLRMLVRRGGMNAILRRQSKYRNLTYLLERIRSGRLDNISVLNSLIKQVEFRRYADRGLRRYADKVIAEARKRKNYVNTYYQSLPKGLKERIDIPVTQ